MSSLTILGLGPGSADWMTRIAWETLLQARVLFVRTAQHPAVQELPAERSFVAFDDVYEQFACFEDVYSSIAERVLSAAESGDVVYAVPGDPSVAETTTALLLEKAKQRGLAVRILPGVSFVEPVLAALELDLMPGMVCVDAQLVAKRYHPPFDTAFAVLLPQVYDRFIAGDVKLALLNQYPPELEVALVHGAGSPDCVVEWCALAEIDHSHQIGLRTVLFMPAYQPQDAWGNLLNTIAHLRSPEGCPWDMEQTHQSLRANLLEETYELLDAFDREDLDAMREEMGDVLLQVLMHAQIAVDDAEFTLAEVVQSLNRKLVSRHPHVFGDKSAHDADSALANWEASKRAEKKGNAGDVLASLPTALPALALAQSYQKRVGKLGFDWDSIDGVLLKVQEEILEVQAAEEESDVAAEVGDLLFAVVNYARWRKVDAETCLREASARFRRRFARTQANLQRDGYDDLHTAGLERIEEYWQAAKRELRAEGEE